MSTARLRCPTEMIITKELWKIMRFVTLENHEEAPAGHEMCLLREGEQVLRTEHSSISHVHHHEHKQIYKQDPVPKPNKLTSSVIGV